MGRWRVKLSISLHDIGAGIPEGILTRHYSEEQRGRVRWPTQSNNITWNRNQPHAICSVSFALTKGCSSHKGVSIFAASLLRWDEKHWCVQNVYVPSPHSIAAWFWRRAAKLDTRWLISFGYSSNLGYFHAPWLIREPKVVNPRGEPV